MANAKRPDTSRIKQLTEADKPVAEAKLKFWIDNYHRTDPANRKEAEEGALACYELAGYPRPSKVSWHVSPLAAVRYVAKMKLGLDKPTPAVVDELFAGICYGPEDVIWLACFDTYNELGQFDLKEIEPIYKVALNGHIWFALEDEAIMIERPVEIYTEPKTYRPHRTDGPILRYGDEVTSEGIIPGFSVWAIDNFLVNEQIVMRPETLTVQQITSESNAEVRRIMIDRFGIKRFLQESGAKMVDCDGGPPGPGGAPRVLVEDALNQRWLIGTDGSTTRVYYMPVHRDAKTCREAHERISGISEANLVAEC